MRILIFSLFVLLTSLVLHTQTIEETFQMATQLHEEGRHDAAHKFYQRVVFFDKDQSYPEAIQRLAELHLTKGNHAEALLSYKKALIASDYDNIEAVQGKCLALMAMGKTQEALLEIYQIDTLAHADAPSVYHFLLGTAQYGLGNRAEAKSHFNNLLKGESEKLAELDVLFADWEKIDSMNPKRIKLLSYLLPGLGQASIGEFGEAANSLFVNAGFYYLFISMIRATAWLDAILLAYPWFNRYYHGGAARAYRLAKSKKIREKSDIYNEILLLLD